MSLLSSSTSRGELWDWGTELTRRSINFNIVSKGLGSSKMSYYLNEAAGDMRDLMMPTIEAPKAKL